MLTAWRRLPITLYYSAEYNEFDCHSAFAYMGAFSPNVNVDSGWGTEYAQVPADNIARDPLNATYWIDDRPVQLIDGSTESDAASGSSTKVRTNVWYRPEYGDINGDGEYDGALILSHDPGGSGTFYYATVALRHTDGYKGANAVLLGDRIIPHNISIVYNAIVIQYAGRRPKEPMSTTPTVLYTAILIWKDNRLEPVISDGQGAVLHQGRIVIGHEVRSFEPCNLEEALWLQGETEVMTNIRQAHAQSFLRAEPYRSVFMLLTGKWIGRPKTGFGDEYPATFWVKQLIKIMPEGDCSPATAAETLARRIETKITFPLGNLDENGLVGDTGAKRALSYEFCIPAGDRWREEVAGIDPTVSFALETPGRIDCGPRKYLCIGSTYQSDFFRTLESLANLPYVQRIDAADFE